MRKRKYRISDARCLLMGDPKLLSGTMLHRDWGGFGFVFRRHVDDLFV